MNTFILYIILGYAGLFVVPSGADAQENNVPVEIQYKILPKILSMNKSLNIDKKDTIRIAIIFNSKIRNSVQQKNEILDEEKRSASNNMDFQLVFVPIDLAIETDLKQIFRNSRLQAVYITPLRGYNINLITEICRSEKIVSFSSISRFIDYGVSVVFNLVNNKLRININLENAKGEGANFSSHLLKIARIVN